MKKILYIISSLLLMVGCAKDLETPTYDSTSSKGGYKITAYSTPETKVDIDGTIVKWDRNDVIKIAEIDENGTYISLKDFTIDEQSISEDGKYADFYGDELDQSKQYVAVKAGYTYIIDDLQYYQDLGVVGSLGITSNNSETQYADSADTHVEVMWNMISPKFQVDQNITPSVGFSNIGSYMRLDISLDDTEIEECEIESITFSAPNIIFSNEICINSDQEIVHSINVSSLKINLFDQPIISSSKDYTAYIPFIPNENITEIEGDFTVTLNTTDDRETSVTFPAKVLTKNKAYNKTLKFPAPTDMITSDRGVLIDLYNSTNGDSWTNNTNWCSDAPIEDWYGVGVDSNGRVRSISLSSNNLTGTLPESICKLSSITNLQIYNNLIGGTIPQSIGNLTALTNIEFDTNEFTGEIPVSICNLTNIESLWLCYNQLTGTIPESIGNLTNLGLLNLNSNQLTGNIPESMGNLVNLYTLNLSLNQMTGEIPTSVAELPNWSKFAWQLTQQSDYGFSSIPNVYLEPTENTTVDNQIVNTKEYFANNELTCIIFFRTWCYYSTKYLSAVRDLYNVYSSDGFGLIALSDEDELSTISNYVTDNAIPGYVCQVDGDTNGINYMPTHSSPTYAIVDKNGKVVFSESLFAFEDPTMSREDATSAFLEEYFGKSSTDDEVDYSKDGEVMTLQTATQGTGIDLVIVGDGFTDTQMDEGGVYETRMKEAMEHFFSEEPYTTFRNRYNVYAVKAVSKDGSIYNGSETAFSAKYGDGTAISGDDSKIFEYALKVPSITNTENVTIIAVLNSSKYAGTCYMYTDNSSIAYCPIVSYNDEEFRQIITHECGGHGFAKLLDEYAYDGTISSSAINDFKWQKSMSWGANVDITSDASQIQWAHLLSDSRYEGLVGIYEGALTFMYGAYRPTDVSIMRYNIGGYNAPSREEIYERIMVLSGDSFDYEEFVAYDAINRTADIQTRLSSAAYQIDKTKFVPLGKPVIVKSSPKISR